MSSVFLVVPVLFLKFFFKEKFYFKFLDKKNIFLFLAFCMPLIWPFMDNDFLHLRWVNFLQHMIGGGVAVGFLGLYLLSNFREMYSLVQEGNLPKANFPQFQISNIKIFLLEMIFIFMLVSAFGCLNELLEFYLDLLNIGIFSADRYDTWFDIVANSSGALSVYFVYKFIFLLKSFVK